MKMKKPILTSDLSFAYSICGDAAEYFDPFDPEDIANKIIFLVNNINRQKELIQKGEERLQDFETPDSRAKKLLEICYKIGKSQV
jgi:glycosyltransferase involved in cell wall biosynthesis